MSYEFFFAGIGSTAFGALLGSWISCRLTFGFQKRLLQQQLDFQKLQGEADAALRKQMHDEMIATFKEFRNMLNTRFAHLPSSLSSALDARDQTKR
jgi:hypothetical protein